MGICSIRFVHVRASDRYSITGLLFGNFINIESQIVSHTLSAIHDQDNVMS